MILKQKAKYSKEPKEFFFLEAMPNLSLVQHMASPRTLNTHVPYRWLPKQHIESGGKIIHVVRNPKDVAVSLYHHLTNMREFASSDPGNFEEFFETKFMNPKGKRCIYTLRVWYAGMKAKWFMFDMVNLKFS